MTEPSTTVVSRGDERSKGDRTRRRLLDAAAGEIARRGPDGTSLAGVARRSGLKPGSVYFHFSSREALIEAVLEEGVRESLRILDTALATVPEDGGPVDRLRAAIRGHLEALHRLSDYAVVVLAPQFTPAREAMPSYRELRHRYVERWAELVAEAQDAGALAAGVDPRGARDLILGALNAAGLAGRAIDDTSTGLCALLGLGGEPGRPRAGAAGPSDGSGP